MNTARVLGLGLVFVVGAVGCGGGGGGGGAKVYESGSHTLDKSCANEETDSYRIDSGVGTLAITATWDDSNGIDDLDLVLYDDDDVGVDGDSDIPPGDSPANISFTVADAARFQLDVECWDGEDFDYELVLVVP